VRRDNWHFFPLASLSGGEFEPRRSYGDQIWPLSYKPRTVAMPEEYYETAEAGGAYTRSAP
jgi:hypothetical protein